MITPKSLKKGDRIEIVAPAGRIAKKTVEAAKIYLEKWGLKVSISPHLYKANFQYSADDAERLSDFQQAMDNPDINAILCARGGYGSIRILDQINFEKFVDRPKWIIGFSDITVLHAHIHNRFAIETIHGSMAAGIIDNEKSARSLRTALFGKPVKYRFKSHKLSRKGKSGGILTGGNLAILTTLLGSPSDIDTKDKILFIEDVGENLYRIDRMMWTLKRAGKLDNLAGLVVGGMTEIPESKKVFGKNAYEIIHEHIQGFDYPVCYNFPAGHRKDNRAIIFGRFTELEINSSSMLKFG